MAVYVRDIVDDIAHLQPTENKVVIKMYQDNTFTNSGIYLPTVNDPTVRKDKAIAIAVGPDVKEVQPGDIIIFSKWKGTEFFANGKSYEIILEDDIFAVIEGDSNGHS